MNDKEFYLIVEKEIEQGKQDQALLSKAKIKSEENGLSINANYTNLRVEELTASHRKEKAIDIANSAKEASISVFNKLLPVAVFLFIVFLIILFIAWQQGWS